jgi:hypothetical protein
VNGIPRELDWVKERAACSLARVFQDLHMGVQGDVRKMNEIRKEEAFGTRPTDRPNRFIAFRMDDLMRVVHFALEPTLIEIRDGVSGQSFDVGITLNDEGQCKLRIGGDELEQWQVRRRVLEALFFAA